MKNIFWLLIVICSSTFGQKIEVSTGKTTIVVFQSEIIHADIGSKQVGFSGEKNTLKIKAKVANFTETNLFVETEKGYYSYMLIYNSNPSEALKIVDVKEAKQLKSDIPSLDKSEEKDTIPQCPENVVKHIDVLKDINDKSSVGIIQKKIKFYLSALYAKDDYIYFKVNILNNSNMDYDIDMIRFVVTNNKGITKRATVQQKPKEPLPCTLNDEVNKIKPHQEIYKIYSFPRFNIDKSKHLDIELWEKGGDRNVVMQVDSESIMKARTIRD